MDGAPGTEAIQALGFPTATPILDVLHPLPHHELERLRTGDYFFISSLVIIAFTELTFIRAFVDTLARQSLLSFINGVVFLPLLAFVAAVAAHQAGHLLAAHVTGFQPVSFRLGPLVFARKLRATDAFSLGLIVMRTTSSERLRQRLTWLVLGGPLGSLTIPIIFEAVLRLFQYHWNQIYFLIPAAVHVFSTLSFLLGVGSLLPDIDSSGNFSDGTRLLMILKNDFRAARWLAIVELQVALNSRQFESNREEALLASATAQNDESFDAVASNWLAYLWSSNRQDTTRATKYLEAALNGVGGSPGHLRDRIFLEAAVFQAWYRHNSVKSRFWALQINAFTYLPPMERRRLEIASCWADGKSFDALEKLSDYLLQIQQMPPSSARDSAEKDALEWKQQMQSRMLSGAWATIHSWPYHRQTQSAI
jgi:hypothetical protein